MLVKDIHITCMRRLTADSIARAEKSQIRIYDQECSVVEYNKANLGEDIRISLRQNVNPWVFTSIHGVRSLLDFWDTENMGQREMSCYAIEGRTAQQARDADFRVKGTAVNSQKLAQLILNQHEPAIFHITSADRLPDLECILTDADCMYQSADLYQKRPIPFSFPEHEAVIFFSPSQVRRYCTKYSLKEMQAIFCIGNTTAEEVRKHTDVQVKIAAHPSEQSLIEIVCTHYETA